MKVKDLMTPDLAYCTPLCTLVDVARIMRGRDCGAIPVVKDTAIGHELVGIITDRDIVMRSVAEGLDPTKLTAGQCMSMIIATVSPDDTLEECADIMEEHQVRRVPVVDRQGNCCGIVSQADVARSAPAAQTADVVREVSQPSANSTPIV